MFCNRIYSKCLLIYKMWSCIFKMLGWKNHKSNLQPLPTDFIFPITKNDCDQFCPKCNTIPLLIIWSPHSISCSSRYQLLFPLAKTARRRRSQSRQITLVGRSRGCKNIRVKLFYKYAIVCGYQVLLQRWIAMSASVKFWERHLDHVKFYTNYVERYFSEIKLRNQSLPIYCEFCHDNTNKIHHFISIKYIFLAFEQYVF